MAADPFPPPGDAGFMQWVIGILAGVVAALFGLLMKLQADWRKADREQTREVMETVRTVERLTEWLRGTNGSNGNKPSKD